MFSVVQFVPPFPISFKEYLVKFLSGRLLTRSPRHRKFLHNLGIIFFNGKVVRAKNDIKGVVKGTRYCNTGNLLTSATLISTKH